MEEVKENKSTVTSYRLKDDAKDKIKQQLKDLGLTQEEYFNKVVSLMELENVKQNSFLSKDTTIIKSNLDSILNAFINIADDSNNLITNKDTELQASKQKYKDMLSDKENVITEQKQELQQVYSNLSMLQSENDNNKTELMSIKVDYIKQIEQLDSSLKDKNTFVQDYKEKNDMLLSDLAEYKQYKAEVEQYKKLLADAQAKIIEKDISISGLNDTIKNNEDKYIEIVDRLKKDNAREKINEKIILNLEKENELLELRKDHQVELEKLNKKHNEDIQDYQNKYKLTFEQMEKERSTRKEPVNNKR